MRETERKKSIAEERKIGDEDSKGNNIVDGELMLTAADRVKMARMEGRPGAEDYIGALIEKFFPLAGDRKGGEDESVLAGIGFFRGRPVTVIGLRKGRTLEEKIRYRFGMPNPEGYRKAERLMRQAEKFGRPLITFVDTPGAYPGKEAEERGQGEAIARCLAVMSRLQIPTVAVFIGEGGSGGALAIGVADRTIMLENSIFSILSPEGFASILWKDAGKWKEASQVMKLTAADLKELGIVDQIISEKDSASGMEGAHQIPQLMFERVGNAIAAQLEPLLKVKRSDLAERRYKKLRMIGAADRKAGRK